MELLPEEGQERRTCAGHRVLSDIHKSKGETTTTKAVHHCEVVLGSASSFKMAREQCWVHFGPMLILSGQHKPDNAQTHVEKAKSHAADTYLLARATGQQARLWIRLGRVEEARPEALGALDAFERPGAADDVRFTRWLLRRTDARVAG